MLVESVYTIQCRQLRMKLNVMQRGNFLEYDVDMKIIYDNILIEIIRNIWVQWLIAEKFIKKRTNRESLIK